MKYRSALRLTLVGIILLIGLFCTFADSSYLRPAQAAETRLSAFDLENIAKSGGSLQIDASHYSAFDLGQIAKSANSSPANKDAVQVKVTLLNVQNLSAFEMQNIATAGNGAVTFILDK